MLIEFEEILHDLELKRAAALDRGERPAIDVAAALGSAVTAEGLSLRVRDEDGSEQPFEPALAAALVADALSTPSCMGHSAGTVMVTTALSLRGFRKPSRLSQDSDS